MDAAKSAAIASGAPSQAVTGPPADRPRHRAAAPTGSSDRSPLGEVDARPTVIDLFAGCGGGSLGFMARGFRVAAAVEIDRDAARSYELNTGIEPVVLDIRKVQAEDLLAKAKLTAGQCTVMVACPPCQSFTVLRRGRASIPADEGRDGLAKEFLRLVAGVLPSHVVFENVPGMRYGRGRPEFLGVVRRLRELGYKPRWRVLDAAEFGVPQHRRRLVLIGSRTSTPRLPKPTHGSSRAGLPALVTVKDAIGELTAPPDVVIEGMDPLHVRRRHGDVAIRRLEAIPTGGGRLDLPDELQLACHRGHKGHYDVYGRMSWDSPSPTITSGCTNITRGRFAHPEQNRAITLREAMRLQSFPDTATVFGRGDGRAQQIGNAVPTLLASSIAQAVIDMDAASENRGS